MDGEGNERLNPIPRPYGTGECFFCGERNPVGLKLKFRETEREPKEVVCRWTPPAVYKGFGRVLHGGIQSGLFDEIMGWASWHFKRQAAVTVSMEIRFVRPLLIEQEIEVRCRIDSHEGKRINLSAEIRDQDREVCTKAKGTYVQMEAERFKGLVEEP